MKKLLLAITILLLGRQGLEATMAPKTSPKPEDETIIVEGQEVKPEEDVIIIQEEIPTNASAPEEGAMIIEEEKESE